MQRLKGETERGAVTVVVALLMVALLSFTAIGIDIAGVASERQMLQNGADAGALAIAQDCADKEAGCASIPAQATASTLVHANRDTTSVATIAPTPITHASGSVTVTAAGTRENFFGRFVGAPTSEIAADATAVWERKAYSGGIAALPVAFSLCSIEALGDFTYNPETGNLEIEESLSGKLTEIPFPKSGDLPASCSLGPSNFFIPGGFSWLEPDGSGFCVRTSEVGEWITSGNGGSILTNSYCTTKYLDDLIGKTVALPVFDAYRSAPEKEYRVYGYVGFTLKTYNFGKGSYRYPKSNPPCPDDTGLGNGGCIVGVFTNLDAEDGEASEDAPPLGVTYFLARLTD